MLIGIAFRETALFNGVLLFTMLIALGLALQHPSADVRKVALQAGVAIDSADVLATLLAVRAGAPKSAILGAAGGAVLFVMLGLKALTEKP